MDRGLVPLLGSFPSLAWWRLLSCSWAVEEALSSLFYTAAKPQGSRRGSLGSMHLSAALLAVVLLFEKNIYISRGLRA